jgi:hypothetical protein
MGDPNSMVNSGETTINLSDEVFKLTGNLQQEILGLLNLVIKNQNQLRQKLIEKDSEIDILKKQLVITNANNNEPEQPLVSKEE